MQHFSFLDSQDTALFGLNELIILHTLFIKMTNLSIIVLDKNMTYIERRFYGFALK